MVGEAGDMSKESTTYAESWRRRCREGEQARAERTRRARAVLPELADLLVRRHRAGRVWLVGSLAAGGFAEDSDIDLVVEGLESSLLLKAGAEVERAAREFRVDLIPFEQAAESLRKVVREQGELIGER